jgi:hypothetical protein
MPPRFSLNTDLTLGVNALKVPTLKNKPDLFLCGTGTAPIYLSEPDGILTEVGATHQHTIHWMPLVTQLWMNRN